jgi:hypothetical protein
VGSHHQIRLKKKSKVSRAFLLGRKGLTFLAKKPARPLLAAVHMRLKERKQCPMDLRSRQLDWMERVRRVESLTVAAVRHSAGIALAGVR